jgi:hypothetical protein
MFEGQLIAKYIIEIIIRLPATETTPMLPAGQQVKVFPTFCIARP